MTIHKTLTAFGEKEIDEKINEALKDDWKHQGGISLSTAIDNDGVFHDHFAQGMIKIKTEHLGEQANEKN